MPLLVFEDNQVGQLSPITLARPAYCITAGSYNLLELLQTLNLPLALVTRKYLRNYCQRQFSEHANTTILASDCKLDGKVELAINARLCPSASALMAIQELLSLGNAGKSGVVMSGDSVAAVVAPKWNVEEITSLLADAEGIAVLLEQVSDFPEIECELNVMNFPHDVIASNMSAIQENLAHRIENTAYDQLSDGLFVGKDVSLGEYLITDTSAGPIVIEDGASVGPYTLLRGPVFIGKGCRILEHAAIKDEVSLGHTTKIGGEVEAAVVEAYSNKQHHGFLGHSYLGSWINLGAGTCNSDLKNTYGLVNMEYPSGKTATGMQFLGCVMGDYSKTAINTGIFTGKVIGVCSMMYGFVTSNVPSFVNYARLFGQLATLPPEVMIATQKRMFSRRKVEQLESDMQLIRDMYRLSQSERDRVGDEIAF